MTLKELQEKDVRIAGYPGERERADEYAALRKLIAAAVENGHITLKDAGKRVRLAEGRLAVEENGSWRII
ncbi:MAG: hypothetical protein AB1330_01425 [Bacillota bacterium]